MEPTTRIETADGVSLGVAAVGSGDTVVVVHGAANTMATLSGFVQELARDHRVVAYDRRGRGHSGDASPYDIELEAADLACVVAAQPGPVHLVAHSFGATCALVALASQELSVDSVALYEPPTLRHVDPTAWAPAIDAIDRGDFAEGLRLFAPFAGLTSREVAATQLFPQVWEAVCDAMGSLARELDALHECSVFEHDPIAIEGPALLIEGELTGCDTYVGVAALSAIVPGVAHCVLPGQRHTGLTVAPAVVADVLRRHFALSR